MAPDFDIGDDAMTQEMASIARAIQTILPNHKCFYEDLQEGYTSPAIFFPIPDVETYDVSLDAHSYEYSWFVKIFDVSDTKAWEAGEKIQRLFKNNRNLIPIVSIDGTVTDNCFRISNTTLKRVDFHVMQVYIRWKSIYTISDTAEKTVQDFGINFM